MQASLKYYYHKREFRKGVADPTAVDDYVSTKDDLKVIKEDMNRKAGKFKKER